MKDIDNDNLVVLSGAERIVLVDDFINAPIESNSGRTTRRYLQYILLAMKAAGTPIEIFDHEGGMSAEKFGEAVVSLMKFLRIEGSVCTSKTNFDTKVYLRILPRNDAIRKREEEAREMKERFRKARDEELLQRVAMDARQANIRAKIYQDQKLFDSTGLKLKGETPVETVNRITNNPDLKIEEEKPDMFSQLGDWILGKIK